MADTEILAGRHNAFPRTARLLKPADFKRVFRKSSASSDRYFKVLARPSDGGGSRLGLAVSRKVDKRAVGRNRIKRVTRESFRMTFESRPRPIHPTPSIPETSTGLDFVVLPRPICATICNRQLRLSLDAHWSRLRRRFEDTLVPDSQFTARPDKPAAKQKAGRE